MAKKKMAGNSKAPMVIGKILALAGMYVLTGGLIGDLGYKMVLTSAIFWGLLLLALSKCLMYKMHLICSN